MKKRTLGGVLLLVLTAATAGCASKADREARAAEEEIKEAVYGYGMATGNYRLDEAEQFCTEETANGTLRIGRMLLKMVDTAYIAADQPAEITVLSVRRTSDTSAVATYRKQTPIKDFVDSLEVRNRDGRWLVYSVGTN